MNLSDQVSGWCAYGFRPREAVRELILLRMARQNAKGNGNRARRRALKLARTVAIG